MDEQDSHAEVKWGFDNLGFGKHSWKVVQHGTRL